MEMMRVVGIVIIALGVLILTGGFLAYARHRLTESFGMVWGLIAVCLLAVGIVLLVSRQGVTAACVIAVLLFVLLVMGLFGLSQVVSVLLMKNQELAMQVSLLNQENESILQELAAEKEKSTHE